MLRAIGTRTDAARCFGSFLSAAAAAPSLICVLAASPCSFTSLWGARNGAYDQTLPDGRHSVFSTAADVGHCDCEL